MAGVFQRIGHGARWTVLLAAVSASTCSPREAAAPVRFQNWSVERYGEIQWTPRGDAIELNADHPPAGLVFRRDLDSTKTYRLTIAGTKVDGETAVRLTTTPGRPEWLPAPDGSQVVVVTGPAIEVVVYGDADYAYRLSALDLEECTSCISSADAARMFPPWNIETFGSVDLARDDSGVRMHSAAAPGGLYFRRTLDPGKTYRLRLDGTSLSGKATSRLTLGDAAAEWFPAPNGSLRITVADQRSVELLLYGDEPYEYRLASVTLDECPACLSDAGLKRLLLEQIPSLGASLLADRFAAVDSLLDWTANVVDWGDGLTDSTAQVSFLTAAQTYQDLWLDERGGGTSCAGFAAFFAKVLQLFGVEAFTVDIGYPGTLVTHVTTVVVDPSGRTNGLYIFDPTFNGTYVDPDTRSYLPIAEVLARADRNYQFRVRPIRRDAIFSARDAHLANFLSLAGKDASACNSVGDPAQQTRVFCPDVPYDIRYYLAGWRDDLKRLSIDTSQDLLLTLMRARVFSTSTSEARRKRQLLATLDRFGIPFGMPASRS